MRAIILLAVRPAAITHAAAADTLGTRGWAVHPTSKPYAALIDDVKAATKANGLIVVTQAGPTKAAANRGIAIPGNRVACVFNNDFTVRVLETSTAAMIEAPIRLYIVEDVDGTATISYKPPATSSSHIWTKAAPRSQPSPPISIGALRRSPIWPPSKSAPI